MSELAQKRPKHLNLFQIKLPVGGVASILHRVSGFALFLLLPLLIWMLELSLASPESHEALRGILAHPLAKLVIIGLIWAFLHHFFMGIRILLIDLHIGVARQPARATAIAVLVVSLSLTAVLGVLLW